MKKQIFFLLTAIILSVTNCTKLDVKNNKEQITIPPTVDATPVVPSEGGETKVSFTAVAAWTAQVINSTKSVSWVDVNPKSGNPGPAEIKITTTPNNTNVERSATIQINCGGQTKDIVLKQEVEKIFSIPNIVDLGLSVKWASFNIGASSPEEYGAYYQWGGMEDVTSTSILLNWNSCPFHTGSSSNTGYTKYVSLSNPLYWSGNGCPDDKTVLDPEDDVAHVKLGSRWRMPTEAEWKELIENCTWTWTTFNGENGYEVTSNKPGYTDKSIFLPAASYRNQNWPPYNPGDLGFYWSSSLFETSSNDVYQLNFNSNEISMAGLGARYFGNPVRPVYGENVTGVSFNMESFSLGIGKTFPLSATIYPSYAGNKEVIWSSSNTSVATVDQGGKVTGVNAGSATITVKTTDGDHTATCSVTVKYFAPEVLETVDLGLSVKWASLNLGANRPEESGGYYQWAGTQDVTSTSISLFLSNCPYHTGSSSRTGWTKYIPSDKSAYWSGNGNPDNKTVLDPDDDVAHVTLGSKWRIPTDAEWEELIDNCTWTWTTLNGEYGYEVTSNMSGYTDKSIFLPAAGQRSGSELGGVSVGCYYWSSSLYKDEPYFGKTILFKSDYGNTGITIRNIGQSVRPVYGDRISVTGVSLNKTSLSLNIGEISTIISTISPSNAMEQGVSWSSSNPNVATVDRNGLVTAVNAGSTIITVRTTDGGYTATCSVTVNSGTLIPEMVDLGLSVKWASSNLGASEPENCGGLYQWAGTENVINTDIYLELNNCPYHTGWSGKTGWTKYIPSDKLAYWSGNGSPDNKTVLDPDDDVAHVTLGSKWRIPTDAEWEELIDNCTWTWTTLNGEYGYEVTSNKPGYTDKSIFLPATWWRISGELYLADDSNDYSSVYWSSSLNTSEPFRSHVIGFHSVHNHIYRSDADRDVGLSIRPVSE